MEKSTALKAIEQLHTLRIATKDSKLLKGGTFPLGLTEKELTTLYEEIQDWLLDKFDDTIETLETLLSREKGLLDEIAKLKASLAGPQAGQTVTVPLAVSTNSPALPTVAPIKEADILNLSQENLINYFTSCKPELQKQLLLHKSEAIQTKLREIPLSMRLEVALDNGIKEFMKTSYLVANHGEVIKFLQEHDSELGYKQWQLAIDYLISTRRGPCFELEELALGNQKCALALISMPEWKQVVKDAGVVLNKLCERYVIIEKEVEGNKELSELRKDALAKQHISPSTALTKSCDNVLSTGLRKQLSSSMGSPAVAPEHECLIKGKIVGDKGVGKTSLLIKFTQNIYIGNNSSNLAIDYHTKIIKLGEKKVKLQVSDTASQVPYKSISPSDRTYQFYIFAFDVTNSESFNNVKKYCQQVRSVVPDAIGILVGTKAERVEDCEVDEDMANKLAKELGMWYVATSAKIGANVEEIFKLASTLHLQKMQPQNSASSLQLKSNQSKTGTANQSPISGSETKFFRGLNKIIDAVRPTPSIVNNNSSSQGNGQSSIDFPITKQSSIPSLYPK